MSQVLCLRLVGCEEKRAVLTDALARRARRASSETGADMNDRPVDAQESSATSWGSGFFGTLNDMPPEPVAAIGGILEAMRTEPAFQEARQTMLRDLVLPRRGHLLPGGWGR